MRKYDPNTLIVHPGSSTDPDVVVEVTEVAGWDYIHFQVRRLGSQRSWSFAPGDHELAIVPLSGSIRVESDRGQWSHIGERQRLQRLAMCSLSATAYVINGDCWD
jgi:5-deoxy-glucuronate isomerase